MVSILLMFIALLPAQRNDRPAIGITVYADPDFRGKSAQFRENTQDLRPFGLTDKVSSLRVPQGEAWEVCEHINYQGRCRVFTYNVRDLHDEGFNDIISSVRRVADSGPGRGRGRDKDEPRLELFDQRDYRGRSVTVTSTSSTLAGFSNRAGSVRVLSGNWEVCERPSFRGTCVEVSRDVPDLRRLGLNDQLSSARPIRK